MKTLSCIIVALLFPLALASAEMTWAPTPMVIDAPFWINLDYDSNTVDIPFNLSGKGGMVWLIIESRLDEENKPVSIMNGFRNWHYVSGIDTTIYVSAGEYFDVGTGHTITWERENAIVGIEAFAKEASYNSYNYYLWAYDSQSNREVACAFLPISSYGEGQYLRFYVNDDHGIPYDTPLLMGQLPYFQTFVSDRINNASIFKWQIGSDPYDESLLVVSSVPGFDPNEVDIHPDYDPVTNPTANYMIGYGSGAFDPGNHDIFYFTKNKYWNQTQTVVKYTFVPDGVAEQDSLWGDYHNNLEWYHPGNKGDDTKRSSLTVWDYDKLVMLNGGTNPSLYPHEQLRIIDKQDPFIAYWDDQLDEFYMENQPANTDPYETRFASEINRLNRGPFDDTIIVTGDMTCLTECINLNRFMYRATGPYTADGYVTWANSNGDFFLDMSSQPGSETPWACIVSDPKTQNNPRRDTSDADMNGFVVAFVEFCGINSFGVYCPDGTGIELAAFADDDYYTGTPGDVPLRGGGEILDYGGTYDGLYTLTPLQNTDVISDPKTRLQTWYAAFDSNGGIIGLLFDDWTFVNQQNAPTPFTVAQNHPNPFNPSTTITFTLAADGPVTIDVRNIAGQKVDTLVDDVLAAGEHSVVWDATGFAAGTYFYTVSAGGLSRTMKMTLVK